VIWLWTDNIGLSKLSFVSENAIGNWEAAQYNNRLKRHFRNRFQKKSIEQSPRISIEQNAQPLGRLGIQILKFRKQGIVNS
jgi:hypothetical protein